MYKNPLFAVIAGIMILSSCAGKKQLSSSVHPSQIHDMAIFEPVSRIHLIERGNNTVFNDSLSNVSSGMIVNVIISKPAMPENMELLILPDTTVCKELE